MKTGKEKTLMKTEKPQKNKINKRIEQRRKQDNKKR